MAGATASGKTVSVVCEENITTDEGMFNYISLNFFDNGQLVRTQGPEGPEAGIINYTYDKAARTVTATFTYHDVPYYILKYYYDASNNIIAVDDSWPGTIAAGRIIFANGFPIQQKRVYEKDGDRIEEEQLYTVVGKRLSAVSITEKRYGADGKVKVLNQKMMNEGGSPFLYEMKSDDGNYSVRIRLSNKYFAPGYNIQMYPDVDLRNIHLSRNDVLRPSAIGRVVPWAWFSQGMLEMEYDEFSYGMRYHRWVTDIEANKDHQPATFHRTYQTDNRRPLVTRFIYKYVNL